MEVTRLATLHQTLKTELNLHLFNLSLCFAFSSCIYTALVCRDKQNVWNEIFQKGNIWLKKNMLGFLRFVLPIALLKKKCWLLFELNQ